ncbi:EF-P 5-aminopentanol modification-associated protein YfmF [Streptococcus himalayensis]|uniref:Peptidase M16 n=1 Tax=Streptococcus himalayensis TaxID=1888195 RepID=A0A917A3G8_9STRE|nr:pitrilysin family protein [Streptococcus himalayensis]GGE23922.1 peptidase M16 [Streptococcus himalayensis]
MELVTGVHLHFISSDKYKTNRIKMRFAAPLSSKTVAGRVLAASMLETANLLYPTSQTFRERLATLYGATYSTSVAKRGMVHYVDINLSFVRDSFLSRKNTLTEEMLEFLKASLLQPLVVENAFEESAFAIEKRNVLLDLEAEIENHFYHAHRELNQVFYEQEEMQIPRIGTIDLISKENAQTSFEQLQSMLNHDRIDVFFIGDFNEIQVVESMKSFNFTPRTQALQLQYSQPTSNIVREGLEQKDTNQSIIELGYHFSTQYGEDQHLALIVLNGLLGGFSHSKLFVNIREKEGLAYTISSQIDIFSGLLRVYAGIDRLSRTKTVSLIHRQISDLKKGIFTDEDLSTTKEMLKNTLLISLDRQNTLIERAYLKAVFGRKSLSATDWLTSLQEVSREDVMEIASQLNLQAVYFMEGK